MPIDQSPIAKSRRLAEVLPEADHPADSPAPGAIQPMIGENPGAAEKEEASDFRRMVDLVSDKHGPKFLSLQPEERNWLMKVHKKHGTSAG